LVCLGEETMSAIVGIYNRHLRSVDRSHLEAMVNRLAHRGNDGVGLWCEGSIGLGHRLLWTTPESLRERFPLVNEHLILTADARIDNREELISGLSLGDHTLTDSQLILAAYCQWGDRCPEHLLGDFAFAIWDQQKQSLFCARDHFGVKPFYYYASSDCFAFATEIKGLLCLPEVPQELNETRIAEHLDAANAQVDRTFYEWIYRLPPAHCLTVQQSAMKMRRYWQLDVDRELRLESDAAYAEQFLEIFTEAVRCRLRSAFPIGSMLSGGLDSSSITCVARQILAVEGISLHTFSARYDQVARSDERRFQEPVLQQGNLTSHYLVADQRGPLTEVERMMWHQDEAIYPGNLYMIWGLYSIAQSQVRVLLDGFDGDTTVSHGTEYLRELAQSGRWKILWNETKAFGQRFDLPWKKVFLQWVWRYGIKPKISWIRCHKPASAITNLIGNSVYSDSINQQLAKQHPLNQVPAFKTERENHHYLLNRSVMPYVLETMNQAAGAFSLEVRVPFFDKRLVEFCLALPPEQKLSQGWGRVVMRRAMAGILPESVQWRVDKSNLHHSFEQGLRTFETHHFASILADAPTVLRNAIDLKALGEMYDRFLAQTATEEEVNLLWRTVTLGLWLRSNAPASFSTVHQEVISTIH
jgi:asparagine synthase (glutamine-hydrolysing)